MTNQASWRGEVDLVPGDLIEIFRDNIYQHWAVYVGSGEVIHVTSAGMSGVEFESVKSLGAKKAIVKREPLSDVVRGNYYRVSNKHDDVYPARTPDQIVTMAKRLEGQIVDYSLLTQNCEHFSNSLRYDVSCSNQVRYIPWLPVANYLAALILKIQQAHLEQP